MYKNEMGARVACVESDVLCANLFMCYTPSVNIGCHGDRSITASRLSIFRRFFRCNQMRCDACVGGAGPGGLGGVTRVLNYPQ